MTDADHNRPDAPLQETSPSAGFRVTAAANHTAPGRGRCDYPDCDRPASPVVIRDPSGVRRIAACCAAHDKEVLRVTS